MQKKSVEDGLAGVSQLSGHNFTLCHLMNNLCALPFTAYLEVGVEQGALMTCAVMGNTQSMSAAYGVENWKGQGGTSITCMRSITKALLHDAVRLYDSKSSSLDIAQAVPIPITLYCYNTDCEADSSYPGFTHFDTALADVCILVVTHWNNEAVRTKALQAYQQCGYTILFEQILPASTGVWKNAVYIAVIKKNTPAT